MTKRGMHSASLKKSELECSRLELEARESSERAALAEAERDTTCHEVAMAKLATEGAVNIQAQIESELARVQRALALAEEARRRAELECGAAQEVSATVGEACKKAEEENNHLAYEKLALVIELGDLKDDFTAFREKAAADKEKLTQAAIRSLIMATVVALSRTTYVVASLKSRMGCPILRFR